MSLESVSIQCERNRLLLVPNLILSHFQVCRVLSVVLLAIVQVWYMQYYQPMVLNSLVVSLIPVVIVVLQASSDLVSMGIVHNVVGCAAKIVGGVIAAIAVNTVAKVIFRLSGRRN
jgi:hypothetical protein